MELVIPAGQNLPVIAAAVSACTQVSNPTILMMMMRMLMMKMALMPITMMIMMPMTMMMMMTSMMMLMVTMVILQIGFQPIGVLAQQSIWTPCTTPPDLISRSDSG